MSGVLQNHLAIWQRKPVLRMVYDDFYRRIIGASLPGPVLEIGGGIGNLKSRLADVVSTDIQFARWLSCVADAQRLPFAAASFANIVMVDVCHHLEFPIKFFLEAQRVLQPGGRVIMVEPAITWGSALFYRCFHEEPVRTAVDPLADGVPDPARDPYDANQAIPTLIATRHFRAFHVRVPGLKISRIDWFSLAVYPLSGGMKRWCLVPAELARRALWLERLLEPLVGRLFAFRMMLVIDKVAVP